MKTPLRYLAVGFILFTVSCSKSGTKALEKGNYYEAVLQAVEKLKKDTDNSKSSEVLPAAYKNAQSEFLRDIDRAQNANQQFRWESVLDYYTKLNKMQDAIELVKNEKLKDKQYSYEQALAEKKEALAKKRKKNADALRTKLLLREVKKENRD